jgi:hypothetical protein
MDEVDDTGFGEHISFSLDEFHAFFMYSSFVIKVQHSAG